MTTRKIFYSFHFDNDVFRVQQIRNIGTLEDNKPVAPNEWETVKKGGDAAIKKWINDNMAGKSCVVVLIGSQTAARPWVKHEILKAWNDDKRAVLGINIHNLKDPKTGTSTAGINPFTGLNLKDSKGNSVTIPCKNPSSTDAYNSIKDNLEAWVEEAIAFRANA